MAKKVLIELVSDLDGGPADETVRFGMDGTTYEIDLSAEDARALRRAFKQYVRAARKAPAAGRAKPAQAPASTGSAREDDLERAFVVGPGFAGDVARDRRGGHANVRERSTLRVGDFAADHIGLCSGNGHG